MAKIRILVVCMWPWGGIRTYLKYVYHYFPADEFDITLLANPTVEKRYLEEDMRNENIDIVWAKPFLGMNVLSFWTAWILLKKKFDVIHSHGFITAFHVSLIKWLFRTPHLFTIHSILVDRYFQGTSGRIKRFMFKYLLKTVTVFHGVSNDILEYSKSLFPNLGRSNAKWVAIPSGIHPERFKSELPAAREQLRIKLRCDRNTLTFGFFGRFQPEKGFEYIIDAVEILRKGEHAQTGFIIMAIGPGDDSEYRKEIEKKGLADSFRFLPSQPDIASLMKGCNAVLMPSIVEGFSMTACESLCAGIPLIATNCLGLREVIENTPAISIPPRDSAALAKAMSSIISDPGLGTRFADFQNEAVKRFDIKSSAGKLISLFKMICKTER